MIRHWILGVAILSVGLIGVGVFADVGTPISAEEASLIYGSGPGCNHGRGTTSPLCDVDICCIVFCAFHTDCTKDHTTPSGSGILDKLENQLCRSEGITCENVVVDCGSTGIQAVYKCQ